jgi:SAM-dependent methyltransferase
MSDTAIAAAPVPSSADDLVDRLFGATLGALELLSVHLGWRLGLYRLVADQGPLTQVELAARAGVDERYTQEWLEQQAAAGILGVDDAAASASERRYLMPPGHRDVLVDPTSLRHLAPFAAMVVGIAEALSDVVDAYRTGAGVPYERYGADFRDGQGAINRPAYEHHLASWIEAMPDVHQRLLRGGRVVDLGCGQGWSTIALARAYPDAEVIGVDTDPASITDASANATATAVDVRLIDTVLQIDAPVDLVCIFEALHDMAQPAETLDRARALLGDAGAVLVVDERVEDSFAAPAGEVERLMYGWSVLHCLPASRAEAPSAALGTVLRRPVLHQLAAAAGYRAVTELEISSELFRFYRMDP